MGLFKPAWMTTNPNRAKRAIASLDKLYNNELHEVALKAPLEEVSRAAYNKARYETEDLVYLIVHANHASVAYRAARSIAHSSSSEGWLTTIALQKEGHDNVRELAIACIGSKGFLKRISEESGSEVSRKLATQKLQYLEQAEDPSTPPETLTQLVSVPDADVVTAVARNTSTPTETLVELLSFTKDDDQFKSAYGPRTFTICQAAACNPSTPYDAIVEADQKDPRMRLLSYADSARQRREAQTAPATKPEWALLPHTRGDVSPRNKSYLFLHVMEDSLQKEITEKLLSLEHGGDYAIWTTTDPTEVFARIHDVDFDRMRIFLPVVTPRYLSLAQQALSEEEAKAFFGQLQERGTAVIPLFLNDGVIFEFSRLFGEMHGFVLNLPDIYDRIAVQLERFTTNANWGNELLRQAFYRRLFLSYRKKDRQHLFNVMQSIHDTRSGSDAAIWFDDFLVAGNNFNEEIDQELNECETMVLLVTDHLTEGSNYVKQIEYPHACELNKQVVPVEAEETDREKLERDYANLSEPVWYFDREKLNERLSEAFQRAGLDEAPTDVDPFRRYLQGMCFLYAVMVEKDVDRAVELLKAAAERDVADAAEQLALMYTMGFGVKKDADKALKWKLRAYELITAREESDETLADKERTVDRLHDLLYEDDGLVVMLGFEKRQDDIRKVTRHFVQLIEQDNLGEVDPRYELWRLEALVMRADALRYGDGVMPVVGAQYTQQAKETLEQVIASLGNLPDSLARERTTLEATVYAIKADITPLYEGGSSAPIEEDYRHAIALLEELEAAEHDYDTAKLLRSAYSNLASLKKDVVGAHKGADPEEMQAAWESYIKAMEVARQLVRENPTTNNLESLVMLIFQGTQLLPEIYQAIPYWDEGLECIEKLEELGNASMTLSRIKHIFEHAGDEM